MCISGVAVAAENYAILRRLYCSAYTREQATKDIISPSSFIRKILWWLKIFYPFWGVYRGWSREKGEARGGEEVGTGIAM